MCGRFALRRTDIRNAVDADEWIDEQAFVPRYNIAPRTNAPVIRRVPDTGNRVLHTMKWGLVPHWSDVEDKSLSTTNARAENLVQRGGGMWATIKGTNRCAVVCQGYYEWLPKSPKEKLPHFIKHKDGQLMLMAGLYDHATINGQSLWTFTIVTTDACPDFNWLHDRQPVILSTQEALEAWLDPSTQSWTPALTKLVQPYSDQDHPLECYQVPKEVGKVGTESPSFIEPIKDRKDGIQAMFQRQTAKRKREEGESTPPPTSHTPPPSPKKRATATPPSSPRKRTSPKKPLHVPEKGKITAFFRKS